MLGIFWIFIVLFSPLTFNVHNEIVKRKIAQQVLRGDFDLLNDGESSRRQSFLTFSQTIEFSQFSIRYLIQNSGLSK